MKLTATRRAIVAVIFALIAAWVAFQVTRPARQDLCASEILINGRGGAVNLETKTIKLGSEARPVPLETMTNNSQVLIDQLSRLCREHEAGLMTDGQYFSTTQKLLKPAEKPAAARVPFFDGTIGVTGLVDNRPFRKFAEQNEGKIVRLRLRIDASAHHPLGIYFLKHCYEGYDPLSGSDEPYSIFPGPMDNLFGQRFQLVETKENVEDYSEITDKQKQIGCGPAVEFQSNNRKLTWSSGGPGLAFAVIDGFYRESADYMGAGITYRLEEVSGGVADYAETQD